MSLPSGYRQLEYIQSTGTQYIDTGFIPNQDTRIDLTASPTSVAEASDGVGFIPYGAGEAHDSLAFECYTSDSRYEFNYGSYNTFMGSPAVGQKLQISQNKNQITLIIDDNTPLTATLTANTFTAPRNMILFGINRATPLKGLLKLYSCQIYDNGTLIRDYVPCKNPSGELGLYDLVNQQFYSNAGTGTFIAGIPLKFKNGDILNFDYIGAVQSITLPPGTYKLQCWGAQGGSYSTTSTGGLGGYSTGIITLAENTTIFIYVGGQGTHSTTSGSFVSGGFNGGGSAGYRYGGSGGGASDIRVGNDSLYARVIVAGGGGGAWGYKNYNGGIGGGTSGGQGTGYSSSRLAGAGTQSAGGSGNGYSSNYYGSDGTFGIGGNGSSGSSSYNRSSGGGGGWYGGGGSGYRSSSSYYYQGGGGAGGGSGYVYTSSTASNYPEGCLLTDIYYLTDAQTIDGSTSFPSTSGETETGHQGNGYISITIIKVNSFSIPVNVNGQWKVADTGFVNINGEWKNISAGFVNVNGVWKEISV